jgi:signal transduction histidine kinase
MASRFLNSQLGPVISNTENPSPNRQYVHSITDAPAGREQSASQELNHLRLILENLGDPLILADRTAKIVQLDPLARELFATADSPHELQIAANRAKLEAYLSAFTLSSADCQSKTVSFHDVRSQNQVEYAARSGKIYDSQGHLIYTVTVLRDFSAWKSSELSQLERRMLEMEKFAATGKLAGTIAHEINNPLEAIKNAIYLLKDRLDAGSQPIYDALKTEADRVARIVRQMLGLYRNAAHFGNFDLNPIVEDTLTLFARPLEKSRVIVEKRLNPLPALRGSADQFRQLLSNLVVNAQDSMPNGGRLIIRTRFDKSLRGGDSQVRITVADTGSGIPDEIRSRMFEPFVSTKGEQGTGLGLWIVRGIVEGHTGKIQVRSRPGRGTVFVLRFPIPDGS